MSLILTGIITGIIGYISYTAWALTGFGSAIIFQISWYFISLFYGNGDIVDGLLYLSIAGLAVNPYQAYLLHKYVYWKMVFIMIIGFVPFMLIGIQVLLYVKSPWLKRSLGILFLLQWFKMMYDQRQHEKQEEEEKNKRQNIENNLVNNIVNTNNTTKKDGVLDKEEEDEERVIEMKEGKLSIDNDGGNTINNNIEIEIKDNLDDSNNNMDVTKITSSVLINNNVDTFEINDWKSILILLITSSFAGFLGGLFGTAGPPFMVWLTYNRDVDKNIWRACASHMTSIYIIPRIVYILWASGRYKEELLPIYFTTMVCGIFAALIANKYLSKYIDPIAFRRLILLFLLLGSLLLCTSGLQELSRIFAVIVVIIFIITIIIILYMKYGRRTRKAGTIR